MEETITVVKSEDLDKLLTDNPEMKKTIKGIIRKVLRDGRRNLQQRAKATLYNDPRKAYLAVKSAVYKTIIGGNLSILAKRKAGSQRVRLEVTRSRRIVKNRRPRSERTDQIDSYYGADRGFILRFVNAGTEERQTCYGRRGSIAPRNWFEDSSQKVMEQKAAQFAQMVEEELNKISKQNNGNSNN